MSALCKTFPYDPVTSFTPFVKLATAPRALRCLPVLSPRSSVPAFIAYVKAHPGAITMARRLRHAPPPRHGAVQHATQTSLVPFRTEVRQGDVRSDSSHHVAHCSVPTHVALPVGAGQPDPQFHVAIPRSGSRPRPTVRTLIDQVVTVSTSILWFGSSCAGRMPIDWSRATTGLQRVACTSIVSAHWAKQDWITACGSPDFWAADRTG